MASAIPSLRTYFEIIMRELVRAITSSFNINVDRLLAVAVYLTYILVRTRILSQFWFMAAVLNITFIGGEVAADILISF